LDPAVAVTGVGIIATGLHPNPVRPGKLEPRDVGHRFVWLPPCERCRDSYQMPTVVYIMVMIIDRR